MNQQSAKRPHRLRTHHTHLKQRCEQKHAKDASRHRHSAPLHKELSRSQTRKNNKRRFNHITQIKNQIPQLQGVKGFSGVPETGLEPARLSALAPETSASTIPPLGHLRVQIYHYFSSPPNILAPISLFYQFYPQNRHLHHPFGPQNRHFRPPFHPFTPSFTPSLSPSLGRKARLPHRGAIGKRSCKEANIVCRRPREDSWDG